MTLPLTGLPELAAGQLQPEIPINTALRGLEQGSTRIIVIDDSLTDPPADPGQGDAYTVAAPAIGAWEGREDQIAYWVGTAWAFIPPRHALRYVLPSGAEFEYIDGSPAGWQQVIQAADLVFVQAIPIAVSDEESDLTLGAAKVTFRMPYAFTLSAVRASVTVAPTGAALQVDINESGASILSTPITIDAGEKTSTTAATPPVIGDANLADDVEITIDIDAVGSTVAGAGLKVYLIGVAA